MVQIVSFRLLAQVHAATAGALALALPVGRHVSRFDVPHQPVSRLGPVQLIGHVRVEIVVRLLGHEVVQDDQEDSHHHAEDSREKKLTPQFRLGVFWRNFIVGGRQEGGHNEETTEHHENDADVQHADAGHHLGVHHALLALSLFVQAHDAVTWRKTMRVALRRVRAVAAFARLLLLIAPLALALDRQRGVQTHGVHGDI